MKAGSGLEGLYGGCDVERRGVGSGCGGGRSFSFSLSFAGGGDFDIVSRLGV